MSDCVLKNSTQWGKNLFLLLTLFSVKIDSVNESINVIQYYLINKIDNAQKTAESALLEGLKEEFNTVQYHCENLKAENLRLKNMSIAWIIIAEIVI